MPARTHEAVIVGAARTAIGAFQGSLASLPGPRLGAAPGRLSPPKQRGRPSMRNPTTAPIVTVEGREAADRVV